MGRAPGAPQTHVKFQKSLKSLKQIHSDPFPFNYFQRTLKVFKAFTSFRILGFLECSLSRKALGIFHISLSCGADHPLSEYLSRAHLASLNSNPKP